MLKGLIVAGFSLHPAPFNEIVGGGLEVFSQTGKKVSPLKPQVLKKEWTLKQLPTQASEQLSLALPA